jgi:hypothetical protein
VLVDARESTARPRIANAKVIPLRDASKAKDDGRLPMTDHNMRIFVVAKAEPTLAPSPRRALVMRFTTCRSSAAGSLSFGSWLRATRRDRGGWRRHQK